ncbi:hypothetical protein [Sphingobacterium faecium]|uniref:hypothetical protein n=1 Tax=Sphingobacterium faecium TaxID=34087 RepID=UPI00320A485E
MTNKINKQYHKLGIITLMTLTFFTFLSCKSEDNAQVVSSGASVKVNIIAAESESEIITRADNKTSNTVPVGSTTQTMNQPLGADHSLDISLTSVSSLTKQANAGANSAGNKAATVQQPLAVGTKYQLLIYDNVGKFVMKQTYTYGQEATAAAIKLDAGKAYTFIAVSTNSTSSVPTVADENNLSTAVVANINTELMYFKSTVNLKEGNNDLNVVLRHQYSEIKTTLHMDANTTGNITALVNPVFNTTHSSATLKLSDGVLTYNGIIPTGKSIVFPTLGTGTRTITSNSTLVIHPTTSTAVLNFGSLTIDRETKTNVSVSNLKISPGHRYDLDLTLKTCTQNVSGANGLDWNYAYTTGDCTSGNTGCKPGITKDGIFYANGKTISKTFTAPSADYGFVLDLTSLDNSFNMEVNNVKMATKEIQFQSNAMSPQNIQFADGSKYEGINTEGGANIPAVYNMTGTAANPVVKIVISRFGEVTLFGSKKSGGPLYPLVLMSGTTFNNFSWSGAGTNTVIVTQLIDGKTTIKGTGAGKKKIACN